MDSTEPVYDLETNNNVSFMSSGNIIDSDFALYHKFYMNWNEKFSSGGAFSSPYTYENSLSHNLTYFTSTNKIYLTDRYYVQKTDSSKFLSKNSTISVTIRDLVNYWGVSASSGGFEMNFTGNNIDAFGVYAVDYSGNVKQITVKNYTINADMGYVDITFDTEALPCDVYSLFFQVSYYLRDSYDVNISSYLGTNTPITRYGSFYNTTLDISEEPYSKTNGLLDSIIQTVKNIFNGITELPSKIANSIKGFFDNIVNAITNMVNALKEKLQAVLDGITSALTALGNFIIDGIKGLFVPSDEVLASSRDKWEELLALRFGALYEVVDLCIEYANSFTNASAVAIADGGGSTITFPVIAIPLGSVDFEFGGWEVQLIPTGFEFFFDTLKLFISVSATILFVNGLRNKFDKVVTR